MLVIDLLIYGNGHLDLSEISPHWSFVFVFVTLSFFGLCQFHYYVAFSLFVNSLSHAASVMTLLVSCIVFAFVDVDIEARSNE